MLESIVSDRGMAEVLVPKDEEHGFAISTAINHALSSADRDGLRMCINIRITPERCFNDTARRIEYSLRLITGMKQWIEHHRMDPPSHFLRDSASYRRYPQWPPLVRSLWHVVPAKGKWDIHIPLQLIHQTLKVLLEVPLEHLNALLVHSRSPTVPLHRLECTLHLVHVNAAG